MAPKGGIPHAQKLEMVVAFFRKSRTCHTLKDLEKDVPKACSGLNSMAAKDFIKELTNENKVRVEKIGSGNWYWCWAGEETRERNNQIAMLEAENEKIESSNAGLREQVNKLKERQAEILGTPAHQALLQELGSLELEVKALAKERDELENAVAGGVEAMRMETDTMKKQAADMTDNIYILEDYLSKLAGGDSEIMDAIRRECYGKLYVEGEGLAEIEGL